MSVKKVKDHLGRTRIEVSRYWPGNNGRFRRLFNNPTIAKKTEARIAEAIAMGTWRKLKEELSRSFNDEITIREFSEFYLNEHCRVRNKRPDCKEQVLESINRILGDVALKSFRRSHAHHFVTIRSKEVGPATVNRGIAVLKNMMSFAVQREYIEHHPLTRFPLLVEEKPALRVLTLEEERRLIRCIDDPVIAAFVAFLGETGLRKQEGLNLQWHHIKRNYRIVSVENTKSRKARYVPLSDFALEALDSLPKVSGCPYLFIREESGDRWYRPDGPLEQGRKKAGLDWVTFHDLRHFRATHWVIGGMDIRTVQELLGHSSITVTMRYAHYAPDHAAKKIIEVQRLEAAGLGGEKQEDNTMFQVGQKGTCSNSLDSLAL